MRPFACAFGKIDSYHIPIKCPHGEEARKEYCNFKNFHCYVRKSCGRYRLLWANFELPGSVNDACIFQAFPLYSNIVRGDTLPNI